MTHFEVHQCANPDCYLRLPIDVEVNRGVYCPKCGALMEKVGVYEPFTVTTQITDQTRKIAVILDNIRSAYNVGAIFRTADGVGVEGIFLCGITPNPNDQPAIQKTALGAQDQVNWRYLPNAYVIAQDFVEKGYRLMALERSPRSVPFHKFEFDPVDKRPIALILGNERAGVDPGLLDLCDGVISLPMLGEKGSLNVAVAFGVAAYWLSFGKHVVIKQFTS